MSSELSTEIQRGIAEALEEDRTSDIESIKARECSSDRFRGVQLNIRGYWVGIRPIIDYIADFDGVAIETIAMHDDGIPELSVFVAYLPQFEQEHPAFI